MKILILACVLVLVSCGGGSGNGGKSTPTNPNTQFSLLKFSSITVLGTVYSTQLVGSDSNGTKFTGSYAVANRDKVIPNGILLVPRDEIISISDGAINTTITSTSFVDTNGNLVETIAQTTGVTCAPVSPDKLPDSLKIGDFGIRSTQICDNGTTIESNWRGEDAGNELLRLVMSAVIKDSLGSRGTTDEHITLNASGDVISVKVIITITEFGYTLTLEST